MSFLKVAPASQPCHHDLQLVDLDGKPVPASGYLLPTIRHRLSTSRSRIRRAEDKSEIAAGEHCEDRRWVQMDTGSSCIAD